MTKAQEIAELAKQSMEIGRELERSLETCPSLAVKAEWKRSEWYQTRKAMLGAIDRRRTELERD